MKRFALLGAGLVGAIISLALVGALAVILAGIIQRNEATQPVRVKDYTKAMQQCSGDVSHAVQADHQDFPAFKQVWVTCANQIYLVDLMEDFDIRREKLVQQELDERVILWMVVGITVSGVVLAALQLLGSYRLAVAGAAKFGEQSTLSMEAGKEANKISVQSSVTGLMILIVSLAFFIVYVKWIYTVKEVSIEKPQSLNEPAAVAKISGYGGLGPPPAVRASNPVISNPPKPANPQPVAHR